MKNSYIQEQIKNSPESWRFSKMLKIDFDSFTSKSSADHENDIQMMIPERKNFIDFINFEMNNSDIEIEEVKELKMIETLESKPKNLENSTYILNISKDTELSINYLFKHLNSKMSLHQNFIINVTNDAKLEVLTFINSNSKKENLYCQNLYINLSENSKAHISMVQDIDLHSHYYLDIHSNSQQSSQLHIFEGILGAKLSRTNIHAIHNRPSSHIELNGFKLLSESRQSDTNSVIQHKEGHNTSSQLYKHFLTGKSHNIFRGKIRIEKDAQLVEADQLSRNLLLSDQTRVNNIPMLEIFADDVKCAHGATTGEIKGDEAFYLESRGIHPDTAKKMITQAFATEVTAKIENSQFRDIIESMIIERMNELTV